MEATTFVDLRGAATPRTARTVTVNLIWADKVGLYLAGFGLGVIAWLWGLAAIATGVAGADHLMQHEIRQALAVDMTLAAGLWLFFRATDWLVGGPRRRARRARQ